jgi:hypothetical protein
MILLHRSFLAVRMVAFIYLGVAFSTATSGASPAPRVLDPTLSLLVEANKATYAQFEPVYLACTLKNTTWQAIVADVKSIGLDGGRLSIYVTDGLGHRSQYYSGPVIDRLGKAIREFPPAGTKGDTMVGTVSLFFNDVTGSLAFPAPGKYDIDVKSYLGSLPEAKYAEAPTVHIEVVEPSGTDRQVIESMGGEDRLIQFLRRGAAKFCDEPVKSSCYAGLRGLVAKYPESHYSPAIAFGLARGLGVGNGQSTDQPHLEIEVLQDFLGRWSQHPLAPDATKFMALALEKAGREKEARAWVRRFEEKYPDRESPRRWIEAAKGD